MPSTGYHRPQCEDAVDEDTANLLADNRAFANVAIKRSKSSELRPMLSNDKKSNDGSDSGYSSKAGTSDIMPTATPNKRGDLKINTKPTDIERERQPYAYAPNSRDGSRSSPTKTKPVKMEKTSKQPVQPIAFRHPQGLCWVCDKYGYHFDPEKEFVRPASAAAPKRSKDESDVRPSTARRSSSSKGAARPTSMCVAPTDYGFPFAADFSQIMISPGGYQTAPQPIPQYPPHYQYAYPPPTPISTTPYTPRHAPNVFDMSPLQYALPPESYYEVPAQVTYHEPVNQSKVVYEASLQRTGSRSRSGTQRSKRSAEIEKVAVEKIIMDRQSMPPPPRPERVRPVIQKSPTDYPQHSTSRRRSVFEEDDDDDHAEFRAIVSRERNSSHSRPPSSYKPPTGAEIHGRPHPRKSSSYSTPSGTVHVASSREMPRRKTDTTALRVAEAEAYLEKSRKLKEPAFEELVKESTTANLTPEALKRLDARHSGAVSEAGSLRSRYSSSRESAAGRTRAATAVSGAHITMPDGVSFSIPADYSEAIDIKVGNFRLSMNPTQDELYQLRELRQIERAPSEASQTSRKSLASGSGTSLPRTKEDPLSRQKSSRRSSRAASISRQESTRGSIDYSVLDESYYREYNG